MKFQRAAKTITAVVLSIAVTGCAAMFHGTTQQVSIRSNMDDAKLYVNEEYVGKGSAVTTFHKNKNYTITARKEGYRDTTVFATKSFDAVTLLGILIDWGIISILIIDGAATGAWNQFDQTSFVVDPEDPSNPVRAIVPSEDNKNKAGKTEPAEPKTNFNKK